MEEYFGNWLKVIDKELLLNIISKLNKINNKTPDNNKIFRAFKECKYEDLKVVIIGQDPYPQKGVANGLAFGCEEISPSLRVLLDSLDNECRHKVDYTLCSWAKQGILLLNSALTTEINKIGVHGVIWYPFIKSLLTNLSDINSGIIYVLFGNEAKSFKKFIGKNNYIIEEYHPAYYARNNMKANYTFYKQINDILMSNHNIKINFYE